VPTRIVDCGSFAIKIGRRVRLNACSDRNRYPLPEYTIAERVSAGSPHLLESAPKALICHGLCLDSLLAHTAIEEEVNWVEYGR
jgi:hypothetical protein